MEETNLEKLLAIAASQTHALLALADTIEDFVSPESNDFREQFIAYLHDRAAAASGPSAVARLLNDLAYQVREERGMHTTPDTGHTDPN